ncbi:MAG: carboxypeptidase-like regulatory domain-containing protein [Bryobacter sp.]|nr:carboxypeptidase-like regulatory domain-containing protein [Bryobacter sp. CoA8 C33]
MWLRILVGIVAAGVLPVMAQTALGTITGTVTDPAGSPTANVSITAKAAATGLTYKATTNASGVYVIPNVPIGEFMVVADSSPGSLRPLGRAHLSGRRGSAANRYFRTSLARLRYTTPPASIGLKGCAGAACSGGGSVFSSARRNQ